MTSLLEVGLINAALATALALVVWLATRIWRHPVFVHMLWLVVLLKLITPPVVSVPWRFADSNASGSLSAATATDSAMTPIELALPAPNFEADEMSQIGQEPAEFQPMEAATLNVFVESNDAIPLTATQTAAVPMEQQDELRTFPGISFAWTTGVITIWLSGTVIYLLLSTVRLARFHHALMRAAPAPVELQCVAADLARRFGITNRYRLRVTEGQLAPLVWPIGTPTILMPRRLLAELSVEEVETLLAHEFAHLCRRDHWLRWLELVVTAFYWWHPVVWWAKAAIQRAEECVCDAWVVARLAGASAPYASALFKAVQFASAERQAAPVVASALGGRDLKERIEHIMNATWKPRLFLPVRLLVLAAAMAILPLSLRAVGEEDNATQPVTPEATTTDQASAATGQVTAAATEDAAEDSTEAVESADAATSVEAASTVDAATSTEAPLDSVDAFSAQPETAPGTGDEPAASPAATTANPFAAPPDGGSQPGMHPRRVRVPAHPYLIAPGDVLFIAAIAGGAGRPVIDSDFVVEPSGSVALGPQYGRAKIAGLTLEDAEKAVTAHLKQTLREPMVQITIGGWRDSTMSTARRNRSPSASQRAVQANSDATSTRREAQQTRELADLASRIAADQPALPLPWEQHPFPWEQQNPQPQVSNARRIGSYRDLIPAASSPSVTESIGVLKKIVERSEQDYIRVRELAEKNAVSAAEVGRAKSEYEISVERLRQGERALKYHQAVLAVEEADYQMLDEANRHAPGSVSESALRRAKLAVELARAKLEELAE